MTTRARAALGAITLAVVFGSLGYLELVVAPHAGRLARPPIELRLPVPHEVAFVTVPADELAGVEVETRRGSGLERGRVDVRLQRWSPDPSIAIAPVSDRGVRSATVVGLWRPETRTVDLTSRPGEAGALLWGLRLLCGWLAGLLAAAFWLGVRGPPASEIVEGRLVVRSSTRGRLTATLGSAVILACAIGLTMLLAKGELERGASGWPSLLWFPGFAFVIGALGMLEEWMPTTLWREGALVCVRRFGTTTRVAWSGELDTRTTKRVRLALVGQRGELVTVLVTSDRDAVPIAAHVLREFLLAEQGASAPRTS